jgi:hypothetical protein
MPTFRAKYSSRCSMCPGEILRGQLMKSGGGQRPRHADCEAAAREDMRQVGKQVSFSHQVAAWVHKNPPPNLAAKVAQLGGPALPVLEDLTTPEEIDWHKHQHEKQIRQWLAGRPDVERAYNTACATWRRLRDAMEAHLKRAGAR